MNRIVVTRICVFAAAGMVAFAAAGADTYDYEVENLESSGGQYIDTGIIPDYNTTVKVKIGERRIAASTPIVSWTEQPSNLDTLTFVCDDPERAYRISKTSSGLYVQDVGGLVIIFE